MERPETILVVEDNEAIRDLTAYVLRRAGYVVLEAPNAQTAIQLAEERPIPFNLMLTDFIMPGMSGRELARHMATLHPNTKVLLMSGGMPDLTANCDSPEPVFPIIEKPFSWQSLLSTVSAALSS